MSEGLDVIIVDDDPSVCELIAAIIKRFYTWGEIHPFSDSDKAIEFCLERDIGVAIFVVDVFLGGVSGFYFLDTVEESLLCQIELGVQQISAHDLVVETIVT